MTGRLKAQMISIKGGEFTMGSDDHTVSGTGPPRVNLKRSIRG